MSQGSSIYQRPVASHIFTFGNGIQHLAKVIINLTSSLISSNKIVYHLRQ
jgi:hypothetical protein